MKNSKKIRINQRGGKDLSISHSKFRKILYYLGIVGDFRKIDYLILTKIKESPNKKNKNNANNKL
jgi:hypothetical protein